MSGYKGLKSFLAGTQVTSLDDRVQPASGTRLPNLLRVTVHKGEDLYKPTLAAMIKFNPYVACYLTPEKQNKQMTIPPAFASTSPSFETTLNFVWSGQPLLVVQLWDADALRHEFIGETPVDLMAICNSFSRRWVGPLTMWGLKGTANRGQIWVTIELSGGSPYNPRLPAHHMNGNLEPVEDGRSPLSLSNFKEAIKQSALCC